jgi:hypothetical protein
MTAEGIADAFTAESIAVMGRMLSSSLPVGWEASVSKQLNPF